MDVPYPIKKPEVKQVAPPEQAALFLQQRAGGEQKPCVKVGDKVLTGQVISQSRFVHLVHWIFLHGLGILHRPYQQYLPHEFFE
jgi:Na+-translocating ferredoxin:NAD+ oxidoreductase RnfC subunit